MNIIFEKMFHNKKIREVIINNFHKLYYYLGASGQTWEDTFWFGVKTLKCPLDMWIYQEIIYKVKPDVIIECGTASGGSALFMASICDYLNKGVVLTIDNLEDMSRPKHKRIKYFLGSSIDIDIVSQVKKNIKNGDKVLVILDSDHRKEHVFSELKIYSKLVTKKSYLIVEDTNVYGHPVLKEYGPGPMEAVVEFMEGNKDYRVDKYWEKFLFTFNPSGFLYKK